MMENELEKIKFYNN